MTLAQRGEGGKSADTRCLWTVCTNVGGCYLNGYMSTPALFDPSLADVRVEMGMAEAELARAQLNVAHATLVASMHSVVGEARAFPEIYVGPMADTTNRDHIEFAERAAIADLAVRLALTENAVRSFIDQARTLRSRTPLLWAAFRDGAISPQNARTAADCAATLPDPALFMRYDEQIVDDAARLNPARFRTRARVLRERLVASTADERHGSERAQRRVILEPALDGMCWLTAYLPAEIGVAAMAALDAFARGSAAADHTEPGRTLDHLRADRLGDLLTGVMSGSPVGVRVGLLVPVLSLLGVDDAPATLEGYGPIDIETARRLTACAPSFYRVLTDPISGTVLDIDATTLRIPADMRRWLQVIDQVCTFPGCGRAARGCDLDHTVDRQYGGTTKVSNLAHLCRNHHRLKHQTRWAVTEDAGRRITWTSPTGEVTRANPPPY